MIKLKKTFRSLIGAAGGTDKEKNHPYGTIYDLVFNHQYLQKGEAISVLEIGASKGGSMVAYIEQGEQYINKIVGVIHIPRPVKVVVDGGNGCFGIVFKARFRGGQGTYAKGG